jgi:hypothetical protein
LRVGLKVEIEYLHRHFTVNVDLPRAIDCAHAAAAQHREDLVLIDDFAANKRRCTFTHDVHLSSDLIAACPHYTRLPSMAKIKICLHNNRAYEGRSFFIFSSFRYFAIERIE